MKKIAIFGGSGMTGLCAVDAALKKGLDVQALARDPTRFPNDVRSRIEIVKGDVLNLDDVKKAVRGVDGVVIALGRHNDFRPTTALSDGTKNILAAMEEEGVKPVSVCLSAFLFLEIDKVQKVFREVTKDHQRMLDLVRSSDRDWIAVLPPRIQGTEITWASIKSLPSKGFGYGCLAVIVVIFMPIIWIFSKLGSICSSKKSEPSKKYEIKHGETAGRVISKEDLGYFLVDCLNKTEHYHQLVGIANK